MKRLCIFVTYDDEQVVDDYIGCMLRELRKVADLLVVVCNYGHIEKGIWNIEPYADRIYYRENTGFDAGAYKDALCEYLGWEEVYGYQELVLINDSFYGPIYPLDDLFCRMEKAAADYWGMVRCPAGALANGYRYGSHIQSYFLAFKDNVLFDYDFRQYWEQLDYPLNLSEAIQTFELGCQDYLAKLGYRGAALTDFYRGPVLFREYEIPYQCYSLELIRDMGVPLLKRKCFRLGNHGFLNAVDALAYVKEKGLYDVGLIEKHLVRISQLGKDAEMINAVKLEKFYCEHAKTYFYGAGTYSRNLASYFQARGWQVAAFLVTDAAMQPDGCIAFEQADIQERDGIIIAVLDAKMYLEILEKVRKRCTENQIFYR